MVHVDAPKAKRAAPLPPEERRAAILTAAMPLVQEHGRDVTTKAIAEAAGVAEGTIFRVFKDKTELVECVVERAFDTGRLERQVADIDLTLPLEERLLVATRLIQKRLKGVWQLMAVMRMGAPPHHQRAGGAVNWDPKAHRDRDSRVINHLTRLFEPDVDRLSCSPEQAARLLRLITFSGSHPLISHGQPLTAEEIVHVLLHGITDTTQGDASC
ncbi:MAG: TetR/AcrR family transcriptional regulator [Actinomycetales bacterium]